MISLAVAAAGWVGLSSPGDYATFEFLPPSRHDPAVVSAALVVDGGIYRHDFVAQAVVTGLMQAGLDTGVPVLSVSLTPHHFQETDYHIGIFMAHFVQKGREAAHAALQVGVERIGAVA